MKFGKLHDINGVDFSLPPTLPATTSFLATLPVRSSTPTVYIGCTGWSMKEWVGKVYPQNAKSKDFLRHYTRQFNTIELNTTHYRIPTVETIEKWKQDSAADFRFCPKIPQTISHSRDLGQRSDYLTTFCENIVGLEEKLGCCFMQLPPYFGVQQFKILEQFVHRFPRYVPLAIELRHESWFAQPKAMAALGGLLQEHGMALVMTDVAGRRDVLHQRLSADMAMIRFVGNGLHASDYTRIKAWVNRLCEWFEQGLSTVYFFPHEPDNLLAPDIAAFLLEELIAKGNINVRGPELINPDEGKQISLF